MLPDTEERVDRLEIVLEQFISESNMHLAETRTHIAELRRLFCEWSAMRKEIDSTPNTQQKEIDSTPNTH